MTRGKKQRELAWCPGCRTQLGANGVCPACGYHCRIQSRLKRVALIFLVLAGIYLLIGVQYWRTHSLEIKQQLYTLNLSKSYEVNCPPPEQPEEFPDMRQLAVYLDEQNNLRTLFEARRFAELSDQLAAIEQSFAQNPREEYRLTGAYWALAKMREDYRPLLDTWVDARPGDPAPYLARASYLYELGRDKRGTAWASKTSKENFAAMRVYFQDALVDLRRAVEINPRLLQAHLLRIAIENIDGDEEREDLLFNQAREFFPDSSQLYKRMMWAKLPRWGGSYARMEEIADEARQHLDSNPELILLYAEIYLDQAWYRERDKHHQQALVLIDKALAYGGSASVYEERARSLLSMQRLPEAFADINRSIHLNPGNHETYHRRSVINYRMGNIDKAVEDAMTAWKLAPNDPAVIELHNWALKRLQVTAERRES